MKKLMFWRFYTILLLYFIKQLLLYCIQIRAFLHQQNQKHPLKAFKQTKNKAETAQTMAYSEI